MFILLQEKISSVLTHIAVSQSGARERDREREIDKKRAREPEIRSSKRARAQESELRESSFGLFYSPFLPRPPPSLLYRERYQFVYRLMVIQKREANAPLTICVSLPLSLLNHSKSSHKECLSNYEKKTYNTYI